MKRLIAISTLFLLPACSIFGKDDNEIVFDTVLGPETKIQVKSLPSNLQGDSENARYMTVEKKGQGMESQDGSDEE